MNRFKNFFKALQRGSYSPLLFILFIWLVFSSPYILQGLVPFPSTFLVNHFHPWRVDQQYWGPVKNPAMPDVIDQIYPWRHFTIESLQNGSLALWNPNSFSGSPHLANVQSAVFSPVNILFLTLPFIDAWSLAVLLQPLVAGIGMLFFLRVHSVSRIGSLVGSISWMFCGFVVVWMAYGTLSLAIALLPLVLFSLEKLILSRQFYWGIASSLFIAFSFFAGHFQTSLYLLLFSAAYATFRLIATKKHAIMLVFVSFSLGLLLASIQILPAIQFYLLSPRSGIFQTGGGIDIYYLITIVAPDFFGNPVTGNNWYGYYAEWAGFVGGIPLFLALLTIVLKKTRTVMFFISAAVASLVLAIASPVQEFVQLLQIPVLSTSSASRIIVLFSFSAAVLAGFGFDGLRGAMEKKRVLVLLFPLVLVGVLLAVAWGFVLSGFLGENTMVARSNMLLPTGLLGAFCLLLAMWYLFFSKKLVGLFVPLTILLLVVFDSYRFASKWMPFDPREYVYPDMPVITAMQERIGNGRVFGNIGEQVATMYNLPIIEGYDPLYPERYGEFIIGAADGQSHAPERSVVRIDRNGLYTKRVLDLLGVNLIYHPNGDTNQSWAFPVWNDERYQKVYDDNSFLLYENTAVINRPALYYEYEVVSDGKGLLKRFYAADFDYRNVLLLEEQPSFVSSNQEAEGKVNVLRDNPEHLVFEVNSPQPGLLFLSDNYYPGWKAYVNGEEVKIYRADYAFRAIEIPEGESTVEFRYTLF